VVRGRELAESCMLGVVVRDANLGHPYVDIARMGAIKPSTGKRERACAETELEDQTLCNLNRGPANTPLLLAKPRFAALLRYTGSTHQAAGEFCCGQA
jgi:hypothetical protein